MVTVVVVMRIWRTAVPERPAPLRAVGPQCKAFVLPEVLGPHVQVGVHCETAGEDMGLRIQCSVGLSHETPPHQCPIMRAQAQRTARSGPSGTGNGPQREGLGGGGAGWFGLAVPPGSTTPRPDGGWSCRVVVPHVEALVNGLGSGERCCDAVVLCRRPGGSRRQHPHCSAPTQCQTLPPRPCGVAWRMPHHRAPAPGMSHASAGRLLQTGLGLGGVMCSRPICSAREGKGWGCRPQAGLCLATDGVCLDGEPSAAPHVVPLRPPCVFSGRVRFALRIRHPDPNSGRDDGCR